MKRPFHGVLGGLVAHDEHGFLDADRLLGLSQDVEVLAGRHLVLAPVQPRQGVGDPGQPTVSEMLVGPRQHEVAEENRDRRAVLVRVACGQAFAMPGGELAVQAWTPAAGVRAVHDVIVGERAALEPFQCSGRMVEPQVVRISTADEPPAAAEQRAQPLAVGDEVDRGPGELGQVRMDVLELTELPGGELIEGRVDPRPVSVRWVIVGVISWAAGHVADDTVGPMTTFDVPLAALLRSGQPSVSFEFFPPKDDEGEDLLWRSIAELEPLNPTFVSVTYGAGGTSQDRTVRVTARIADETTLRPVGHLTVVGQSRTEIESVLKQYSAAGIDHVLALRGDPKGGPRAPWETHPDGMTHAIDLVEMAGQLGGFCVGVAAFPEGHPDAPSLHRDAEVLAEKARAGAEFAITQLFFRASDYFGLVERVRTLGAELPIIPGIMPILNFAQVARMAELSGAELPREVLDEIEPIADDRAAVRARGIELATQLCRDLLDGGAPGLHFITLNRSTATREIFEALRDEGRV